MDKVFGARQGFLRGPRAALFEMPSTASARASSSKHMGCHLAGKFLVTKLTKWIRHCKRFQVLTFKEKGGEMHFLIVGGWLIAGVASAYADPHWEALPTGAAAPADNPITAAKVSLGKMLFFDARFSSKGTVPCFPCRNIMDGSGDHRATSIGVHGKAGGRNAPTAWNAAFLSSQLWVGRPKQLEQPATGPPVDPVEIWTAFRWLRASGKPV